MLTIRQVARLHLPVRIALFVCMLTQGAAWTASQADVNTFSPRAPRREQPVARRAGNSGAALLGRLTVRLRIAAEPARDASADFRHALDADGASATGSPLRAAGTEPSHRTAGRAPPASLL